MTDQVEFGTSDAVTWAHDLGFRIDAMLTDQPWSTVWRVIGQNKSHAILKQIHQPRRAPLGFLTLLPDHFPDSCVKVIASDPKRGLFLYALVVAPDDQPVTTASLVTAYGQIQSKAASRADLLTALPTLKPRDIYDMVVAMATSSNPDWPGNGFDLLDRDERATIRMALERHLPFINRLIAVIDASPPTINHTDLRHDNAIARTGEGGWILDWDDAAKSAPGWSLHSQFSGCLRVFACLNRPAMYQSQSARARDETLMAHYVSALAADGAYDPQDLKRVLPATAAFGIMKYATDMVPYDISDPDTSDAVRDAFSCRFKDLTQFLDIAAPKRKPDQAGHKEMKSASMENTAPNTVAFPEISYGDDAASVSPEQMRELARTGADLFRENGTLAIRNCLSPALIHRAFRAFVDGTDNQIADIKSGRALAVGHRRYMISVPTDGVFGSSQLLAAPRLLAVLDDLLGDQFVLGSLTSVLALQGSDAQRWHRDNDPLFPENPEMDMPPFSIAVLIPLVPLDAEIGATETIPGSHRDALDSRINPPVARPDIVVGDCYLMDSRLMHRGMANTSTRARPVLSLVYQRAWYRDFQNFNDQPALQMSQDTADKFPQDRRDLISWAITG